MRLLIDLPRATQDIRTGETHLSLRVAAESRPLLDKLIRMDGPLAAEIKKYRPKRSLSANDYLWVLCDKIAKELGSTKELIYIELIRRVGRFDVVAVQAERMEDIIHGWSCRGLGWFAEPMEGCKIDGCERVMFYYGSSDYDTAEMSRVIDEAVYEAKELGIDTATPDEIERMKGLWANEKQANKGA